MTAAVFGQTMEASSLFGLAVAALGLPVGAKAGGPPTSRTAIRLSAIAAPANTKGGVTETTCNANQKQHPCKPPEAAIQ